MTFAGSLHRAALQLAGCGGVRGQVEIAQVSGANLRLFYWGSTAIVVAAAVVMQRWWLLVYVPIILAVHFVVKHYWR